MTLERRVAAHCSRWSRPIARASATQSLGQRAKRGGGHSQAGPRGSALRACARRFAEARERSEAGVSAAAHANLQTRATPRATAAGAGAARRRLGAIARRVAAPVARSPTRAGDGSPRLRRAALAVLPRDVVAVAPSERLARGRTAISRPVAGRGRRGRGDASQTRHSRRTQGRARAATSLDAHARRPARGPHAIEGRLLHAASKR